MKPSQDLTVNSFWFCVFRMSHVSTNYTVACYSIKGLTWNLPLPWILEKALE